MNPRTRRLRKHNRKSKTFFFPKEILAVLRGCNLYWDEETFDTQDLWIQRLFKLGFEISNTTYKQILINHNKGLVIKLMYSIGKKPKDSIPTFYVKCLRRQEHSRHDLVIQPLVDTSDNNNVLSMIMDTTRRNNHYRQYGVDCHAGNVGVYKNKLVVFDW